MPKDKPAAYQKKVDSTQMSTTDWQQPSSTYSQKFGNETLDYLKNNDARVSKESKQISSQQYKGRY